MAETEINVVNRPAIVSTAIEAVMRGWPILAAALSFGIWLVHLEGATNTNTGAIADVKTALLERDARWMSDQKAQNDRVDRIEESRRDGLQRLAAVEEAMKGLNHRFDSVDNRFDSIATKLDRMLLGGRGR